MGLLININAPSVVGMDISSVILLLAFIPSELMSQVSTLLSQYCNNLERYFSSAAAFGRIFSHRSEPLVPTLTKLFLSPLNPCRRPKMTSMGPNTTVVHSLLSHRSMADEKTVKRRQLEVPGGS